jgi:hypothetical protein
MHFFFVEKTFAFASNNYILSFATKCVSVLSMIFTHHVFDSIRAGLNIGKDLKLFNDKIINREANYNKPIF